MIAWLAIGSAGGRLARSVFELWIQGRHAPTCPSADKTASGTLLLAESGPMNPGQFGV